ncbi:protein sll1483-like [Haliotis rufescens]|uniref:protein sll1483-like n=1 Tax=Haliotis rufescens TaxID=6454 RepID=UPI00201F8029|nr:protein sll1483-like [Haliotis rufescens]
MKSVICVLAALACTCAALTREGIWMQMHLGGGLTDGENIPQLAETLGEKTLVELVTRAGLADTLSSTAPPAPFTVFGPTDDAFAALAPQIKDLLKNVTILKGVLLYHVLSGEVYSTQLSNELLAKSLADSLPIRINIYQGGKVVTAQGSPIVLVNQNATNGVIHGLSRVMLPPAGTVVDVVSNVPGFNTLKTAVIAAKLLQVLAGDGPFTVFAPTDAAFSKLPPGTLDNLLKNLTKLTSVLEYHVVSGTFYSAGLTNNMKVTTLNKQDFTVMVSSGGVSIDTGSGTANVIAADVSITNGVIHVIDEVLIPPMMSFHLDK